MASSARTTWRRRWYFAGSFLVLLLLVLLAHGPSMNTVRMDLRTWRFSATRAEQPEREGRIRITKTICFGPVTYTLVSFDSALSRADASGLP